MPDTDDLMLRRLAEILAEVVEAHPDGPRRRHLERAGRAGDVRITVSGAGRVTVTAGGLEVAEVDVASLTRSPRPQDN